MLRRVRWSDELVMEEEESQFLAGFKGGIYPEMVEAFSRPIVRDVDPLQVYLSDEVAPEGAQSIAEEG